MSKFKNEVKDQKRFSLESFISFINTNFSLIIIFLIVFVIGFLGGSVWTENQILKSGGVAGVKEENTAAKKATAQLENVPKVAKTDHVTGAKNPKVTMITYSDYECPYCARFNPTSIALQEKYGDEISFVYRHYPLAFHKHAQKLAEVSECVAEDAGNEAFWKYTDMIYEKVANKSIYVTEGENQIITDDTILGIAANAGANLNNVKACLDGGEKKSVITEMMAGANKAGISGTPSTVIISKKGGYDLIPGALPLEQVEAMLEKHL